MRSAPGPIEIAYANVLTRAPTDDLCQVVRLLLLLLVYWMVLIYPWGFRIYSRVIEGIKCVVSFHLYNPWWSPLTIWSLPDDIADAFEKQIRCSAATGTQWYRAVPLIHISSLTDLINITHAENRLCSELEERLNIGAWYLVQIAFGAGGFAMFICCCSSVRERSLDFTLHGCTLCMFTLLHAGGAKALVEHKQDYIYPFL